MPNASLVPRRFELPRRRVTRAWKLLLKSRNARTKMAATRTALFSRFKDAFRDIIRQLSNGKLDEDGVDSIIFRLEQLSVHLVRLYNVDLMNNQTERLISNTIMLLRSYKINIAHVYSIELGTNFCRVGCQRTGRSPVISSIFIKRGAVYV
jgi:hypothetical protein